MTEFNNLSVIIAVLVGIILAALFFILRKRSSGRRDFLLCGLCDAGKSAIFVQMLFKKFPETFTSIKDNVGQYKSGRLTGRLVDIPGHYRVREKYFEIYKKTARGIIFVVDSVLVQKEIRDVADSLYQILTDATTQSCPFLILCNKQDATMAKSAQAIKSLLEKELNTVRDIRSRKLQPVGEDGVVRAIYLGKEGRDFEFTHLSQNIQFFECSAKENQLNNLSDWIDRML